MSAAPGCAALRYCSSTAQSQR